MKLPNGFGSVYKLSGKRRNPYVARKTVGWTFEEDTGKSFPVYQFIGYYRSRAEALTALTDYNKDPYDLNASVLTFQDLYDKWSAEKFPKVSESNIKGIKASIKLCEPIKDMRLKDIKVTHLQSVVDGSGKNAPTLKKLKITLSQMFEWAVKNEILPQDKRKMIGYLDCSQAGNPNKIDRQPFSKEEIKMLWDNIQKGEVFQIPLVLIYTGLRISELWNLKKEDVHLEDHWFAVTASKTESGIRTAPIADKVTPFFRHYIESYPDSEWVFPTKQGKKHSDREFRDTYWNPVMTELGLNHHPHDTRHTCVSLLTEAGVDERIIKKIVGHKGQGVTQAVYTHIDMQIKLEAINKI